MNDGSYNELMDYLTARRMSSLGNLALHFDVTAEEIIPIVQQLQKQKRLRPSTSRCQSGCDSCSGCESESAIPALTERTILISLERKEQAL
ncbi:MAG: FeoC-like transcriptional regulator [Planctomycetota bacterium]